MNTSLKSNLDYKGFSRKPKKISMHLESVSVTKSEKLELIIAGIHLNDMSAKTWLIRCYAETGNNDPEAWMCYKSSPAWKKKCRGSIGRNAKARNYLSLNYTI